MKKFLVIFLIIFSVFSFNFSFSQTTTPTTTNSASNDIYAQSENVYENVSSFDGTPTTTTFTNTDTSSIGNVFNYILTIMAVAIVVLIIFRVLQGAVIKGTFDNIYDQMSGKKIIKNAGTALIIFIFAYAVLSFINPKLTGWSLRTDFLNMINGRPSGQSGVCSPNKTYSSTNIVDMLMQDEGNKNKIYTDSKGHPTIGVGFNLDRADNTTIKSQLMAAGVPEGDAQRLVNRDRTVSITPDAIKKLLMNDLESHKQEAIKYAGGQTVFNTLPENIKNVLINMTFNMGSMYDFVELKKGLDAKDWNKVAKEIVDSSYCDQVGDRCSRLANLASPTYCSILQQQAKSSGSIFSRAVGGKYPGIPISDTVVVQGVRVSKSIAPQVNNLLNAITSAGLNFKGTTGWRTYEDQKRLRRTNGCPDVLYSPSNSCRIPTARPGTSRHEAGVAIDFASNGSTIRSGSPLYNWLMQNAGKPEYGGLKKLKSESWHFSVDGK